MYCKKCGKKLPDDAVFCIHCGTKMDIHLDALLSDEGKEDSVNTTMLDKHIMSGTDKQSASSDNKRLYMEQMQVLRTVQTYKIQNILP